MHNTDFAKDDYFVISNALIIAKELGAEYFTSNASGEITLYFNHRDFIKDADGGLEEFCITMFDHFGKKLGRLYFILGNGDYTALYDYTDNDFCNVVFNQLNARIDALEWWK